jgi:hypothetical protein
MIGGASSPPHAPWSLAPYEEPEQEEERDQEPETGMTVVVVSRHGADHQCGDHDREDRNHPEALEVKPALARLLWR